MEQRLQKLNQQEAETKQENEKLQKVPTAAALHCGALKYFGCLLHVQYIHVHVHVCTCSNTYMYMYTVCACSSSMHIYNIYCTCTVYIYNVTQVSSLELGLLSAYRRPRLAARA